VHVPLEGQLELGADAIGTGNQHRLLVALGHFEQRAEAADAGQNAFAHRLLGQRLDALDQRVARDDVHAGVFIGDRSRCHVGKPDRICEILRPSRHVHPQVPMQLSRSRVRFPAWRLLGAAFFGRFCLLAVIGRQPSLTP